MHVTCPICQDTRHTPQPIDHPKDQFLVCKNCHSVWRHSKSRLSPKAEKNHYSRHTNHHEDPNYRNFLNQLWEPLKTRLKPNASGLDFGSGPGPTLHRMAQEDGYTCDHYDPFFHPDESSLRKQYDFVTCSETAEHFHSPNEEFRRLSSLVKSDGWLGLMTSLLTPNTNFAKWPYTFDITHVVFYTTEALQIIAEHNQFSPPVFISDRVILLKKR